jgi:adenylate kinase
VYIGLFGLPGAGKGTQAQKLASYFSVPQISTGDIFRQIEKEKSILAQEIHEILASGRLVSDELVTRITFDRLSQKDCQNGFILDGYPRTIAQAKELQGSKFALEMLLCLDVDRLEIIRRLSMRRVCPDCGSVFSIDFQKEKDVPICPIHKAKLIERPDDSPDSIATRLSIYEKNFAPVADFFDSREILFHIDGMSNADTVFSRLKELIEKTLLIMK